MINFVFILIIAVFVSWFSEGIFFLSTSSWLICVCCLFHNLSFLKQVLLMLYFGNHTFHIWKTVSNCSYLPFCQWINFSTGKFVGHFSFSFSSSMGSILVGYLCWMQYSLCFKAKCSVAKSQLTLHDPMDSGMPGFPVPHCCPEFAQVHVHWISDAI